MENKQKQCPFLIFEGDVPKCKVKHQTGGIEHGYLPLPASDVSKCTELYIDGKPIVTCPGCGSSGVDRQIPEAASPDVTVEEEEVVGEEE